MINYCCSQTKPLEGVRTYKKLFRYDNLDEFTKNYCVFIIFFSLFLLLRCTTYGTKLMFFSAEVYDVSVRTCVCVRVYELNVARRFVDIAYVLENECGAFNFHLLALT